jgi:hypothetical protein
MANTEQTEGTMKRSRIATALSAVTFALGLPALSHANGQANNAAADLSAPTQTAQSASTMNTTGGDTTSASDVKTPPNGVKKHPPTAAMDQATPREKSAPGKSAAKHPPTAAMDSATPQERSPGSTSSPDSSTQSGEAGTTK